MSKFSELQNKHERLLSAKMEKTIQKSEVQKFINEIATGGKKFLHHESAISYVLI